MKRLSNTEAELKKSVAYKKSVYSDEFLFLGVLPLSRYFPLEPRVF